MKMNIHITGCWIVFMASQVLSQSETTDGGEEPPARDDKPYVDIVFYKATPDDWNSKGGDVKSIVAKKSTMYCENRAEECGMKPVNKSEMGNDTMSSSHTFLASGVHSGAPEKERIYVKVPIAIRLPENSTEEDADRYLNDKALAAILKESAKDIEAGTGLKLRKVGEEEIEFLPNHTLNSVIIPIAVVILLVLIVVAIIIRIRGTKQDHKKAAEEVALEKKKPVKLVEVRRMESETPGGSGSINGHKATESAALLDDKDGAAVNA